MLRIISFCFCSYFHCADTYRALTRTGVIKLQTSYATTGFRYDNIRLLGVNVDECGKKWIYNAYPQFREEISTSDILRDKSLMFQAVGRGLHTGCYRNRSLETESHSTWGPTNIAAFFVCIEMDRLRGMLFVCT